MLHRATSLGLSSSIPRINSDSEICALGHPEPRGHINIVLDGMLMIIDFGFVDMQSALRSYRLDDECLSAHLHGL